MSTQLPPSSVPPSSPPTSPDPNQPASGAASRTIAQRVGLARAEAQSYYERGLRAFAMHNYEDALADLDAAIERAPGYTELYCARGVIAIEADKLPGAKEDFEYALTINKRLWLALYGLGTLAAGRNNWKEATDYFTQAQAIAPGRPEVWYYRAVAFYNLGEIDKAAADMKTALRWLTPGDKRRSDAQKWLKILDPNAEIEAAAEKAAAKNAKAKGSEKEGKEGKESKDNKKEKAKEPGERLKDGVTKHEQIGSGHANRTDRAKKTGTVDDSEDPEESE